MTDVDIDALETLAKAATPGPWEVERDDEPGGGFSYDVQAVWTGRDGGTCIGTVASTSEGNRSRRHAALAKRDAEYIAAAHPAAMLALCARVREAEARVAALSARVEELERAADSSDLDQCPSCGASRAYHEAEGENFPCEAPR